jgi:GMP synthase-like glutamine amidotransferase
MVVKDMPKVRMLVLETDTAHEETIKARGTFGQILHHHFAQAGKEHDPPLGVETDRRFVVAEEGGKVPTFDEVKDFDAILMTGSMFDAHGNNQWILDLLALLREVWLRKPGCQLSGVCFGHQLICRLLGAEVAPEGSGDWELGHNRIDLTAIGQQLFRTDSTHIHLHQMHQDHVKAAPEPKSSDGLLEPGTKVHVWGASEHTPIQGIYIRNRVFTTQAHLAFDEDMVHRQIQMRVDAGSLSDFEHADRAKETAHLEHDGDVVAAAILRFFHGDDESIGSED